MKLESLKSGKFSENILSKKSMAMLNGGYTLATGHGDDTIKYHCSGPTGELFDRTTTYADPDIPTDYEESTTMFEGSLPDWYNP